MHTGIIGGTQVPLRLIRGFYVLPKDTWTFEPLTLESPSFCQDVRVCSVALLITGSLPANTKRNDDWGQTKLRVLLPDLIECEGVSYNSAQCDASVVPNAG